MHEAASVLTGQFSDLLARLPAGPELDRLGLKRLKSLLHIDRLPTWTEQGSRSWLCAHLILALLRDDLSQDVLDSSP